MGTFVTVILAHIANTRWELLLWTSQRSGLSSLCKSRPLALQKGKADRAAIWGQVCMGPRNSVLDRSSEHGFLNRRGTLRTFTSHPLGKRCNASSLWACCMQPNSTQQGCHTADMRTVTTVTVTTQGGHRSLKVFVKSIHFSKTWKVLENRIGPRKFRNLMWKVFDSPRVSVLHNHCYCDVIILQSVPHCLPSPALFTLDFSHMEKVVKSSWKVLEFFSPKIVATLAACLYVLLTAMCIARRRRMCQQSDWETFSRMKSWMGTVWHVTQMLVCTAVALNWLRVSTTHWNLLEFSWCSWKIL